jgi:hypothetical protein
MMTANVALFVALSVGLGLAFGRPRNALTMVGAAFDGFLGRMGGSLALDQVRATVPSDEQ